MAGRMCCQWGVIIFVTESGLRGFEQTKPRHRAAFLASWEPQSQPQRVNRCSALTSTAWLERKLASSVPHRCHWQDWDGNLAFRSISAILCRGVDQGFSIAGPLCLIERYFAKGWPMGAFGSQRPTSATEVSRTPLETRIHASTSGLRSLMRSFGLPHSM